MKNNFVLSVCCLGFLFLAVMKKAEVIDISWLAAMAIIVALFLIGEFTFLKVR